MIEQRVEKGSERRVQPERLLRLFSPGDILEANPLEPGEFRTRPVGTDIGEVVMYGLRGQSCSDPEGIGGFTIHEGKLVGDDWENLEVNRGLFFVGVEVRQGNPFLPDRALFCRLDIDGIDKS